MPHAHALRSGRYSVRGQVYHVTCVTDQRRPVFSDFAAARLIILTLKAAEQRFGAHTLAFVLMPDHLHWLFELNSASLSELIRWVKGSSSPAINRMQGSSSTLWQAGFHDHALRRDEDLARLARYIVANPLRAGLVQHIGDYPHWDAVWL
ncbi:REP-associated tyrosine transposase [Craterilacuibacter sp.]|uniref:REP-associated tyrosine transposase n=1 Tax=Craterilacuibacter sp. TaxID=2870909 RepID=UPI003F2EEAF0